MKLWSLFIKGCCLSKIYKVRNKILTFLLLFFNRQNLRGSCPSIQQGKAELNLIPKNMEEESTSKSVKRKKGREWCMTSMLAVVRERFEPEGKVTNGLLLEEGDLVTVIAMNPVSKAY